MADSKLPQKMLDLMEEIIAQQKRHLLQSAQRHFPFLTADDILQPNDFPQLEYDPQFRYEEGILCGLEMMRTALYAEQKRGMNGMD